MRYADLLPLDEAGVRAHVLYHATSCDNMYEMLEANRIDARTGHRIDTHLAQDLSFRKGDADARGYVNGVSLTRSREFAQRWAKRTPMGGKNPVIGCVLVLNGDLIRQQCRMIPVAFWMGRHTKMGGPTPGASDESEEFVVGPIAPLTRFLMEVQVAKAIVDATMVPFACQERGIKVTLI